MSWGVAQRFRRAGARNARKKGRKEGGEKEQFAKGFGRRLWDLKNGTGSRWVGLALKEWAARRAGGGIFIP